MPVRRNKTIAATCCSQSDGSLAWKSPRQRKRWSRCARALSRGLRRPFFEETHARNHGFRRRDDAQRVRSVSVPSRRNYLAAPVVVPVAAPVPVPVVVPVRRSSRRSARPVRRSSHRSCRPVRRSWRRSMPAVWASASDTVSAAVDAATAKAAAFPKREKAVRREIASDLLISLMVKTPRGGWPCGCNSKVAVLI